MTHFMVTLIFCSSLDTFLIEYGIKILLKKKKYSIGYIYSIYCIFNYLQLISFTQGEIKWISKFIQYLLQCRIDASSIINDRPHDLQKEKKTFYLFVLTLANVFNAFKFWTPLYDRYCAMRFTIIIILLLLRKWTI